MALDIITNFLTDNVNVMILQWVKDLITGGLTKLLEFIMLWLNDMVFSVAAGLYEIFFAFVNLDVINNFTFLADIIDRIMLLTGVFMLFKLAFSFLTYLITPDKMLDKSQGAGQVIANLLIAVALLGSINYGFDLLYKLESALVEDNIMARLILGVDGEAIEEQQEGVTIGQQMTYMAWIGFFVLVDEDPTKNKSCFETETGLCAEAREGVARSVLGANAMTTLGGIAGADELKCNTLLSLAAGIFLIVILISFIIDIGVRAFKLAFLQMIAPIPIISYIDPNTKKNLTTWLKMVGSTFLDLFIRIAIMLLSVLLISYIPSIISDLFSDLHGLTWAVAYFLLFVSIFLFAKAIPGILSKLFGFDSGNVDLNPFKKEGFGALTGGIIGGTAAAVTGSIMSGRDTYIKSRDNNDGKAKTFGKTVASALGGGVAGGVRGINAGRKSSNLKSVFENAKGGINNQQQAMRRRAEEGGYTDRAKRQIKNFQNQGKVQSLNKSRNANNAIAGLASSAKGRVAKMANKRLSKMYGNEKFEDKNAFVKYKSRTAEDRLDAASKRMAQYDENKYRNMEEKLRQNMENIRTMEAEYTQKLDAMSAEERIAYENYNSFNLSGSDWNNEDIYMSGQVPEGYNAEFEKLEKERLEFEEQRSAYEQQKIELDEYLSAAEEFEIAQTNLSNIREDAGKEYEDMLTEIESAVRSNSESEDEKDSANIIRDTISAIERQSADLGEFDIELSEPLGKIEDKAKTNVQKIELDEVFKEEK